MADLDTNPDAGSGSDPVSLIEGLLDREERASDPAPRPAKDQPPEPEEEDLPTHEPGPEEDPADDDDGEDDGDEDPEQQPSETDLFTVRLGGQEIQVTREELLKGYTRNADYTKKTQDLAAHRQAVEAEAQRIQAERQHYAAQLDQAATILQAQLPPPPDQSRLHTDPIGYMQDKEVYEARVQQLRTILAERQQAEQLNRQQAEQAQAQSLSLAREALLERLPEWKKPEVAKKEQRQIADYLRTLGYADAELAQASDPRAIVMAKKAMLYDRLQADTTKVQQRVQSAPKMVRPGASAPAPDQAKAIRQQLKRSGGKDLDAAARLIEMG